MLPSFVLTDNKCIISCAITWSKYQNSPLNESNEELRMKQSMVFIVHETVHGIYSSQFFSFFLFFSQDYATKAEIVLELLPFIFGGKPT